LTSVPIARDAQIDDAILVQAAQHGDLDAFETLVRRHQPTVYRIAFRLLGSSADAQDVTQDTFVRAWRGLQKFRSDSAIGTWLYRIVARQSLNRIAARKPTQTLEHVQLESLKDDPSQTVEQRERLAAVTRAIALLPGEQRAALVLREFEGLSYEQLADVLGISVPAVKGRLHRARLAVISQTAAWQ
jgi:RNA polymerase sigma-70 factor, ECF subfamily